jgi:hypothetical protein
MGIHGPDICWRIGARFNSETYLDILDNFMLPSVNHIYDENNFIYQQDNCPVHTARTIQQWFERNNIETLPWPANSPDMNPFENVWGWLVVGI